MDQLAVTQETPVEDGVSSVETAMKEVMAEKENAENPEPVEKTEVKEEVKQDVPEEDPEYELELSGQKQKVKLSQLKKGYMQESDYTRKSQEIAKQREEISPLLDFVKLAQSSPKASKAVVSFIEKLIDNDKINESFVDEFETYLSGGKKVDINDMELNQALADIDPESGVGKALTQILQRNQALEKQLQGISDNIKTKEQKEAEAKHQEAYQSQVKEARTFYETTVNQLADKEKGQFKFETDDDAKVWKDLVFDRVRMDNTEVNSNAEFKTIIENHAKKAYEILTGVKERALRKHLETKKNPLPVENAGGDRPPAGEYQKGLSIQENIEQMLKAQKEKG